MSNEKQAALISEIGELLADDGALQSLDWQGLGFVVTLADGNREMTGYRYLADGSFRAFVPDVAGKVVRRFRDLKEQMTANGDGAFVQCLIHLTRPEYRLRLQFEFDDPKRWAPKKIGLDMSDFAEMLRPE
ncbi:hypothetical protein [Szabonella alba]|uniref:Uncharacterized protein n=1 Tax=Szabonella alba TaxID=2804194 RepID=A0A8K0VBX2_9RHOB|nr:hypothetical protein [Szabonella alba]MBL4916422.1 hypothetical protein [Szabonella alba]